MNPTDSQFTPADLTRLQQETFVEQVDFHEEIDSTNNRALELTKLPSEQLPALVIADSQTAGRGRGENQWWSGAGALTFSVVLDADAIDLPPARWPQVPLTAGLAVCEVLEELLAGRNLEVGLKWPNDVYVAGRKICGILVEGPSDQPGRLLLGIGININNSAQQAPEELKEKATALCDLMGREESLVEVAILVLQKLEQRLAPSAFWNAEAQQAWQNRCLLVGQPIQIKLAKSQLVGVCQGIDDEGALLVESDGKTERCLSGEVVAWGEAAG